jgi:hypothetical protein
MTVMESLPPVLDDIVDNLFRYYIFLYFYVLACDKSAHFCFIPLFSFVLVGNQVPHLT